MKNGLYLKGNYIAHQERRDGITYDVLVTVGVTTYRIKMQKVPALNFGDEVTVEIRPIVYEGKIYYSGEICEKGVAI